MANAKVCFIANDVKVFQSSKKRLKFLEYLKNKLESNGVYFCRKHTLLLMTKMPGLMILKAKYFFRMVHPTPLFRFYVFCC